MVDINEVKYNADGLVPAIVIDAHTKEVLVLAWMNAQTLQQTIDTELVTFWSRSRQEVWVKGATSGNYLHLVNIKVDCDRDSLLIEANPDGPACHLGTTSCFNDVLAEVPGAKPCGEENAEDSVAAEPAVPAAASAEPAVPAAASAEPAVPAAASTEPAAAVEPTASVSTSAASAEPFSLETLMSLLADRKARMPEGSYTTYLFEKGIDKILKKVGEESTEVVLAAHARDHAETIYEISDLCYHVLVLMTEMGISLDEINAELASRHIIDHKVKQEKMVSDNQ